MPRTLTEFRVFLSSPAELHAEVQIMTRSLDNLNTEFSGRGISFKAINWKVDIVPGIASDPQEVINPQLDYDIYVGLLGTHFGTPTLRASSGTEEEFRDAVKRFKSEPGSVRILFYFKNSSADVQRINTEQLSKVQYFRNSLSSEGVLYAQFASQDDLLELFTNNMRKLVETQWDGKIWRSEEPKATYEGETAEDEEPDDEESEGILDLVALVSEASDVVGKTLQKLSSGAGEFREHLAAATDELSDPTLSPRQKKVIVDDQAEAMISYALLLSTHIPVWASATYQQLNGMTKLWSLYLNGEFGEEAGFKEGMEGFTSFTAVVKEMRDQMLTFKATILHTPRLTKKLSVAKRRLITQIDAFSAEATLFVARSTLFIEDVGRQASK